MRKQVNVIGAHSFKEMKAWPEGDHWLRLAQSNESKRREDQLYIWEKVISNLIS